MGWRGGIGWEGTEEEGKGREEKGGESRKGAVKATPPGFQETHVIPPIPHPISTSQSSPPSGKAHGKSSSLLPSLEETQRPFGSHSKASSLPLGTRETREYSIVTKRADVPGRSPRFHCQLLRSKTVPSPCFLIYKNGDLTVLDFYGYCVD